MSNIDTPVSLEAHVRDLVGQLHAMRTTIPGLVFLAPAHARKMIPAGTLPDRFLEKIATAVEQARPLQGASLIPSSSYRNIIVFTALYESLADELEQFARQVRDMILQERHEVGQEALRIYRVARNFNRASDRQELIPYIAALSEALHRRSRPSPGEEEPPADTAPPPADGNAGGNGNQGGKK